MLPLIGLAFGVAVLRVVSGPKQRKHKPQSKLEPTITPEPVSFEQFLRANGIAPLGGAKLLPHQRSAVFGMLYGRDATHLERITDFGYRGRGDKTVSETINEILQFGDNHEPAWGAERRRQLAQTRLVRDACVQAAHAEMFSVDFADAEARILVSESP